MRRAIWIGGSVDRNAGQNCKDRETGPEDAQAGLAATKFPPQQIEDHDPANRAQGEKQVLLKQNKKHVAPMPEGIGLDEVKVKVNRPFDSQKKGHQGRVHVAADLGQVRPE